MSSYEDKYATMTAAELCAMIGQQPRREGGLLKISCYNKAGHKNGDAHPSLVVYGYMHGGEHTGYHCFPCGENGSNSWLLKQYGVREDHYMPTITRQPAQPIQREKPVMELPDWYTDRLQAVWESLPSLPLEAKAHLEKKGFEPELFEEQGWRWHTDQVKLKSWGPGIFIPYWFNGKMVTARLRRLDGEKRSLLHNSVDEHPSWPYNLDAVASHKRVFVTEGETDCLTINFVQQDVPAVGIPGATSGPAIARLIEQAARYNTQLIVLPDNDLPSEKFAARVRLAAIDAKVACVIGKVPSCKDVNEWYQQAPPAEIQDFFKRYDIKRPTLLRRDSLVAVRDVFGAAEDVTDDPEYRHALEMFPGTKTLTI